MFLTGGLRVDGPVGAFADADLPGTQGRVAFAALVDERRPISRDALAEIVWDGELPDKWEGALSTIVSKIRTLLNRIGLDGKEVVSTVGGTYAVNFAAGTWVDLEDAHRRLDRAGGALRHDDLDAAAADATVAAGILLRPFLPGVDIEWVERRRRRLAESGYHCSTLLATVWLRRGDPDLAAIVAGRAIDLDPLREPGHRLLIEAEWQRGDRAAALRALARCEEILDEELSVSPGAEIRELADRMRNDRT